MEHRPHHDDLLMIIFIKVSQVLTFGGLLFLAVSCSPDSTGPTGIIKKPKIYGITIDDTTSILTYGRRFDSLGSGVVESPIASAVLANSIGKGIDGGEVITYDTLDKRTIGGYTTYGYWGSSTLMISPAFNDNLIYFHVTGSPLFAPLLLNVYTPAGLTKITHPSLLDTIDRSSQYRVTWTSSWLPPRSSDSAILSIVPLDSAGTGDSLVIGTADDGSHPLSSADMSWLPAGRAMLRIARMNWNNDTTGGRKVFCFVVAEQGKEVVLR